MIQSICRQPRIRLAEYTELGHGVEGAMTHVGDRVYLVPYGSLAGRSSGSADARALRWTRSVGQYRTYSSGVSYRMWLPKRRFFLR